MAILTSVPGTELASLVEAYGLGPLRRSRGIEAGTVNTSFALDVPSGTYFLRLYEEQGHAGAAAEAELLLHLAEAGVATPAPLAAKDGVRVRTLAGKPAALFPWVDGDMLCQRSVTPKAAAAVGAALARVHRAGPSPRAPLGAGRFGPTALLARCDRVARSTDPEAANLAEPLREAVAAVSARRATDLPTGLVHGDLFRDNVLWHGGAIAALLDFESAHTGAFAFDLAVTILSWCFGDRFDLSLARAVVGGYSAERPLTLAEREAIFDEAIFASLRFTITRITDDAIRVGKKWQRFVARREQLEAFGKHAFVQALAP